MSDPIEIRGNETGDAVFPLIDQAEPMFSPETAAAIGMADAAAEISGATDCAASAMLHDVLGGGADGFDQFVYTAPRLPSGFVDQDHDGLS